MKKNMRTAAIVLLAAVFLLGSGLMLRQGIQYRRGAQAAEEAKALLQQATTPPPVQTPVSKLPAPLHKLIKTQAPLASEVKSLLQLDYSAIQERNSDVFGWIELPGTNLTYPLLRSRDNQDYLYHTWEGDWVLSGSIFLESMNNKSLLDFHTIIYGHHMQDGSVFAPNLGYKDAAFWESNPYFYIATDTELRRYRVFSAYEADIDSDAFRLYFEDGAHRAAAIDEYISSSVVPSPVTPTADDFILTLSTCTGTGGYDSRWVVHTVLDGAWERN